MDREVEESRDTYLNRHLATAMEKENTRCHEINHEDCSPIHCDMANKWTCNDCGDYKYGDLRVESGMKCSQCAYGRETLCTEGCPQ